MASSDFDVELFERRLHTLKDSQESIQGLSAWCLERRQHHKKIVATWLQVLKKGEFQKNNILSLIFTGIYIFLIKDYNKECKISAKKHGLSYLLS